MNKIAKNKLVENILKVPILSKLLVGIKYKEEIKLIKNRLEVSTDLPSIVHMGFNRSASQYLKDLFFTIGPDNGYKCINLAGYAFLSNFPYLDDLSEKEFEKYSYLIKPTGIIYSAFGGYIHSIEKYPDIKKIIAIRDPRDLLVSMFYSYRFSHLTPVIGDKYDYFIKHKNLAQNSSIDDYCFKTSDEVLDNFTKYMDFLQKDQNHFVFKFSEFSQEFENWLEKIIDYTQLKVNTDLKNKLIHDFHKKQPKKESQKSHIRKGSSGDYLNKLQPKTIDELNSKFSAVIDYFEF
ncbi:MAG: sulfotransferase domain-containing protein [Cytophagales bacterium]|nr:sulfotransferase domain-containing protein [Cytophagales bacterium]